MKVKIADNSFLPFGAKALGLAGDNEGCGPLFFEWDPSPGPGPVKFFTNTALDQVAYDDSEKKVALLLECRATNPEVFECFSEPWRRYDNLFDAVLTNDKALLARGLPFRFFPYGGSFIHTSDWGTHAKPELCSMIVGAKRSAPGHLLRHAFAEMHGKIDGLRNGGRVELWGEPFGGKFKSKMDALSPYCYSIVVENDKRDFWFTEKLLDCFAVGTVPIYWGCPSILKYFPHKLGIIQFETIKDLGRILDRISKKDYCSRLPAVGENRKRAFIYRCAEDWIFRNYPDLFE